MKTADDYYNEYKEDIGGYDLMDGWNFNKAITARDKEWTLKIQTALSKTSNWDCKEVLTKLLEDK